MAREQTAAAAPADRPETDRLLALFAHMALARAVDACERDLVARGEAFFHVSGAGHESTAVLAAHLLPQDWLHCHYRDKALMLARGVPAAQFLHSSTCSAASHSAGRQMSAHLSDPSLHVLSLVGPVGNNALQAVGVAAEVRDRLGRPVVLCSVGDGTSQQGEFLEAVAEAVRRVLPVLFLIQDNGLSISTQTAGQTFFHGPHGPEDHFYGLPVRRADGRDAAGCDAVLGAAVADVRNSRGPAIVVMDMERIGDHTNADDETVYRSAEEIENARIDGDPVAVLRGVLRAAGVGEGHLAGIEMDAQSEAAGALAEVLLAPQPAAVHTAKAPLPERLSEAVEFRGAGERTLTMADAVRATIAARMVFDPRITVYGEDVEVPKGDVFGVTRGLSTAHPGRVLNSPLAELTIVGTAVGRALAGGRPLAFIQFADFVPIAFNQIASELGSMYWRTAGGWQCPVIVMVACGAYRPGLGPFHAHTYELVVAHVPGIDVMMPSDAADAAGMLNAAFESGRPTVFFYPKACLNDRARTTSADVGRQIVPVGRARITRTGGDLTMVAWGNTVNLCEKAADALKEAGASVEVIDLRWLSPWDEEAVCRSVARTGRLVVVHEDNRTAGFGAEIAATVAERSLRRVEVRRITRPDTYVPCNFANQLDVLPSFRSVLAASAGLLGFDLTWEMPQAAPEGVVTVETMGSSPADEMVIVAELMVKPGQRVSSGDLLAGLEGDKALFELGSPVDGVVEEMLVGLGQKVKIGTPLLTIRMDASLRHARQPTREEPGTPVLRRRIDVGAKVAGVAEAGARTVGISAVHAALGRRTVGNDALLGRLPGRTAAEILSMTGIESRPHVDLGQDVVDMATEACLAALRAEKLVPADIDMIVCATSTPPLISPSLACLVLERLAGVAEMPAYDVSAACTGYLYALGQAWDFLQSMPSGRVLVVTAEEMSRIVDPEDFGTAVLFGDAATATVVYGSDRMDAAKAMLSRPVLSARGEDGSVLRVPQRGDGFVRMDGRRVFVEAVRKMSLMLERACVQDGISVADLDLIVPHQANGRIIETMAGRLKAPPGRVVNEILRRGNTSSSTIPLALSGLPEGPLAGPVGLCAFGAGYTFGAALLKPVSMPASPAPEKTS